MCFRKVLLNSITVTKYMGSDIFRRLRKETQMSVRTIFKKRMKFMSSELYECTGSRIKPIKGHE